LPSFDANETLHQQLFDIIIEASVMDPLSAISTVLGVVAAITSLIKTFERKQLTQATSSAL
jgi:hypothetical protein